jgi:excisionase family DNA binding protein
LFWKLAFLFDAFWATLYGKSAKKREWPLFKTDMAAEEQWLKNAKAAKLLGVGERTIKRWMKNPALQKALGAVRHGKQWRIPRPAGIPNPPQLERSGD